MNQQRKPRVAIIGGGLSGLATAVHLHLSKTNIDITLLESSDVVGGVIQTHRVDGFLVDHGADMFAMNPPAAHDLCVQIGVADQLIQPEVTGRGARIVHRGQLVPIPDGFVLMRATKRLPMIKTPLLSVAGKLRLFGERFIQNNVSETDQSVAKFVRTRMGNEVLQRIVGPLVAGIYTADIEKLSLLATMNPIAEMVRQHGSLAKATSARKKTGQDSSERNSAGARYNQFRAFRGGMTQLISSLANLLPDGTIRTNQSVSAIQPNTNGEWTVDTNGQNSTDKPNPTFDHVVVATPARVAAKLLQPHASKASGQLSAIESASTAIVVLGVRKSDIARPVETFGFVVPAIERRRILAGSFASAKFAGRAPKDHVLIRVFIGGAMQSHLLQHNDQELIDIAREELSDLIGLSGQPIVQQVIRWNDAMPQYHVGHRDRVREIEDDLQSVAGLSLISNALHGVGISPIIANAKKVADEILTSL